MAVLETIRVKLGILITVLIAVALLSFIIDPSTLQSVASSSSKYDVGEINGNSISYTDFQADVDRFTAINEVITGSSSMDEEQQQAIRDAAWQSLLDQHLFVRNAEKAGLHVGDEEMVALISGDMTSPVMAQNAVFFDENGNFSKDMVLEFVNYINTDQTGRLKLYWDYIQNTAKTQQYYDKYMSLFTQSDFTNPLMMTEEIAENNNTFDVEFVMLPIGIVQDTTITVSDSEIKKYFEDHKKFYKQQASRDIEYVVFEVVPSADDIAAANKDLVDVYDEFATTDNMKAFLMSNSDRQYDAHWYAAGELNTLSTQINDFVFGNNNGVSEVFQNGNFFRAVRVLESANVPDSVYVKYVPEASENVDSLLNTVEPMWITEVPGYEDVMTAKKNSKVTTGGIVFQVLDRTAPVAKKRIAILEKEAVASKETVNGYYSQANTFATKAAGKYENFQNALTEEGVYAHPLYRMLESSDMLGSIDNTKEVTRWAFESKVGDVSNIITIDNNYFIVAALTGIHKEGYADVKDFAASISSYLASEKEAAKKVAEVSEKIAGLTDLEAIAEVLGTNVSSQSGVAFSSLTSQGLDPKFIGAASVAEEGKICGPIAGGIGVYVFKVTGRDTGAFYTEDDAKVRDAQMAQIYTQTILSTMMEEADVKDNRARFY